MYDASPLAMLNSWKSHRKAVMESFAKIESLPCEVLKASRDQHIVSIVELDILDGVLAVVSQNECVLR